MDDLLTKAERDKMRRIREWLVDDGRALDTIGALVAMLRRVEWLGVEGWPPICPLCGRPKEARFLEPASSAGHGHDCPLAALLREVDGA